MKLGNKIKKKSSKFGTLFNFISKSPYFWIFSIWVLRVWTQNFFMGLQSYQKLVNFDELLVCCSHCLLASLSGPILYYLHLVWQTACCIGWRLHGLVCCSHSPLASLTDPNLFYPQVWRTACCTLAAAQVSLLQRLPNLFAHGISEIK